MSYESPTTAARCAEPHDLVLARRGTAVAIDGIAVIALLLGSLHDPIAAASIEPAIGLAPPVATGVHTVVALLSEHAVDAAITAGGAVPATWGAAGRAARRVGREVDAVV